MRRGVRERVGLFTWDETTAAFGDAFGSIEGLKVDGGVIEQLSSASMGHPYLIQLHGYYLISAINDRTNDRHCDATREDAEMVIPLAIDAYERRALRPMIDELNRLEQDYLRAMSGNLGDDRIAQTAKIAQALNKQQKQLSRTREALIGAGIILVPARGQVMFNVPYLADYVLKPRKADEEVTLAKSWRL